MEEVLLALEIIAGITHLLARGQEPSIEQLKALRDAEQGIKQQVIEHAKARIAAAAATGA